MTPHLLRLRQHRRHSSRLALRLGIGLLLCFSCLAPHADAAGRVYHVSQTPLTGITAGAQFRTIQNAARAVAPGDTVLIHTGVYREAVTVNRNGTAAQPIRFEAAPAANVTVTGADRLTGWRKEPGPDPIFSVAWPYSFIGGPKFAHPDDDYHLLIGRAEQVFVQNYPVHQVLSRAALSRGDFCADLDGKRLYIWSAGNEDLNDVPVEASTRAVLWQCTGDYVTLRGIRFRYAANAAQQGSVQFSGRHDVVRDCIVERTNGNGAAFVAPDQTVERCTFQDNGQIGFGSDNADRLLMKDCLIRNNNTKDFSRGWEAGGFKIVLARHAVIDHCRILDNRGVGAWFDIGNEGCEVRNCLIADNEDAGIFYEISFGLHAHDNVIVGNGLADSPGAWGAQAGICLSSSPGCIIERNLLVANREGFDFREQGRTTPRLGRKPGTPEEAVWNHDEIIRHNVLADNRDAQTWGWFDVLDERHWPRAMQEKKADPGRPAQDQAKDYAAKDRNGQPVGLSLERLHLLRRQPLLRSRWSGIVSLGSGLAAASILQWTRRRSADIELGNGERRSLVHVRGLCNARFPGSCRQPGAQNGMLSGGRGSRGPARYYAGFQPGRTTAALSQQKLSGNRDERESCLGAHELCPIMEERFARNVQLLTPAHTREQQKRLRFDGDLDFQQALEIKSPAADKPDAAETDIMR